MKLYACRKEKNSFPSLVVVDVWLGMGKRTILIFLCQYFEKNVKHRVLILNLAGYGLIRDCVLYRSVAFTCQL